MKVKFFVSILFFLSLSISAISQKTSGTVTFTASTSSNGGEYSPKHVLAIWITNSSGTFIRSMKVMATQRIQYLYKWKTSSGLNTVDAVTGATLLSHQTHVISWNCTDLNGNQLPDGDYQFWIEFTDDEVQGPYASYSFSKGTSSVNTNFPNQSKFSNVSIVYNPAGVGVEELKIQDAKILQNTFSDLVYFVVPSIRAENAVLQVYSLSGEKIFETQKFYDNGEERSFKWNRLQINSNIYIYRIENGSDVYSGKFVSLGN